MSRVGWLSWGKATAKSAESIDDEDDEAAVDKILQTQLSSEQQTSQDFSQDSPLLQKKKRKSRELNEDGEGVEESPKKKRKKRKRRKSHAESNDDVGDFSIALKTVLAHMDGTVGSELAASQIDRQPRLKPVSSPAKPNGSSIALQTSTKDIASPKTNGHANPELSDDSDSASAADIQPTIMHHILKNQSSTKFNSPANPKKTKAQALNESTSLQNTRPTSYASSNKEALLASIMKTCSSPAINNTGITQKSVSRNAVPFTNKSTAKKQTEISDSLDLKDEAIFSSPEPKSKDGPQTEKELSQEPSFESGSREASSDFSLKAVKPATSMKKARRNSEKRDRQSLVWRTAGYKPALPKGYTPGPVDAKKRFHCPVDTCTKAYSRKDTLGQHMKIEHSESVYQDNEDGTLSIVSVKKDRDDDEDEEGGEGEEGDEDVEDTLAKKPIRKETPALPNGSVSTKKNRIRAGHSESKDSPGPQKKKHGQSKEPKIDNDKLEDGGSRRSSRKSVPYEEVNSDDEEPLMVRRSRSLSTTPKKPLFPSRSLPLVLPPTARKSRSRSIGVMEPWEIAPGRIQGSVAVDGGSNVEENIAFSSAYIIANNGSIELDGIKFTVLHLPGGTSHKWTSDETSLRVCSVAIGKVHVTIASKEFDIGAHGMWRIQGGETCTVVNLNYGEAVLHVSTLDED